MGYFKRKLTQFAGLALITTMFLPVIAGASPKPLDPGTVHVKVMKRGAGNWIALQENNGVQLFGRIISIGDKSFTVQLHNDPLTAEIYYSDVEYLQTGFTAGQKILMFSGLAAVAGMAAYGFTHIHNRESKPLTATALPFANLAH
jgi:hypothetical protein